MAQERSTDEPDRDGGTRIPFESGMDEPREDDGPDRRRLLWGLAAAGAAAAALLLWRAGPAAPAVERSSVRLATVERGDLVRSVRGSGQLVPERVRFVSALAGGRVDEVRVEPGERVGADSVLVVLTNPDVELQALEARRQLSQAQQQLVEMRRNLREQRLDRQAQVARTRADYRKALRQARTDSSLAARGIVSENQARDARDEARSLEVELETQRRKLELLEETIEEEIAGQRDQVERLRAVHRRHRRQVASMRVKAGAPGVVQDLSLEVGQWVQPGTRLARVAEPDQLMAELEIPQTRAREVRPGQPATIDTRGDTVPGRVRRVDPNVQDGTVRIEVELTGEPPEGARTDQSVEGTVRIEELEDVLHVRRPAFGREGGSARVFRLEEDGDAAVRTPVRFGAGSVDRIQVREGLEAGDRIVVSELTRHGDAERIEIE